MAPVGGLRVRVVFDSLYNMLNQALTDLGWFDAGREHLPISFLPEPVDDSIEVPLNTLVLTGEDQFSNDIELGGLRAEFTRSFYLDFYSEGHALGQHMAYDLRDILEGRMASINRNGPVFTIYDYTDVGDPAIGTGEIENVFVDRAPPGPDNWRKHWWSLAFNVLDAYTNESG